MLRFALLFIAALSGSAAAWLAMQMRPQPVVIAATAPAPTLQMQDVLVVASDELRPAQPLGPDSMRWQAWPQEAISSLYITRAEYPDAMQTLMGKLVRSRMTSGEPIFNNNLVPGHAGYLAAILPSGKRAVAVRISAENAAGHFILPGSRVDVLHTEGDNMSRTVLRNIPVLAIDQVVDEATKDEKGKASLIGKTATLELDPAEAEIITSVQTKGTLSLSLRSLADNDESRQQPSKPPSRIIRAGRAERVSTQ
jgi:pilus assembly protein CpaB